MYMYVCMYVWVYHCRFKIGSLQVGPDRNKSEAGRFKSGRIKVRFASFRFKVRFKFPSHPIFCSHCMPTSSRIPCG